MTPQERQQFEHELWVAIHEGAYVQDWVYDEETGEEVAVDGFDEDVAKRRVLLLLEKWKLFP